MSRKNNRPRQYREHGELNPSSDSQTIRDGIAAKKMGGISKRRIKNRSQVSRQQGKVKKQKYNSTAFSNDPDTKRISDLLLDMIEPHELAIVNMEMAASAEARMIARHNKVKLPKKRRIKDISASLSNISNIEDLF